MKTAVIVGAGLATRLYPITSNIPKVLVNYGQHTILKHLYDAYKANNADEIILIVHSKFAGMVKEYAQEHDLFDLKIKCVDEALGSAYAIQKIQDDLVGHNVVFNWCDIIPTFKDFEWDTNTIYTYGNECRFNFDGANIENVGRTGGNVVGVYQIREYNFNMETVRLNAEQAGYQSEDFIEVLKYIVEKNHIDIEKSDLEKLIDLGDMQKLEEAHENVELNRSFNRIRMNTLNVVKTALNEQGRILQARELEWYKKAKSHSIPKILAASGDSFTMSRISGHPMFKVFSPIPERQQILVDRILKALDFGLYTHHVERSRVHADMKKEVVDKTMARCEQVPIVGFENGTPIETVNGVKIGRSRQLLERALAFLVDDERTYTLIHGDPNFSNTILSGEEIKFIDPRGYFGNTELFGPKIYDEAKVLYALSGYDNFNADPMWGGLYRDGKDLQIDIEPLANIYSFKQFNDKHFIWLGVIWLSLAGYFKNNPLKSIAAYYYGRYLLTKALDKKGRKLQDGSVVPQLEAPVTATLITKCPEKWLLIDEETGVHYRPSGKSGVGQQWKRV
ncbi:GlmU [Serratia phage 4S]|nr:GlmU [Serratia phage 4S]